ncbi:uncharacterized protein LOC135649070 [Musa acuminata AAA Group]|uniref:uncharacterized protein LOC135649070 n=1 Tax=Musa acuminata AAA Group TaxID=214697 RepID=UPI0031E01101
MTSGHKLLTFMDAFLGYNQIRMAPKDHEYTASIMDRGVYCHKVMPSDLKNSDAIYQRMINQMFEYHIRRNMEVYVDMIVKSKVSNTHLGDLTETFRKPKRFSMRLNPIKCTFGVSSGKFLGFIIHQRGICMNPKMTQAITKMQSP